MGKNVAGVFFFCLKFIFFVIPLVAIWWWFGVPWYGEFLKQVTGGILKFGFGMDIISGDIILAGMMNTDSVLRFVIGTHEPTMNITKLISNLPPYVALVLATPALAFWRRLRVIAYGVSILSLCHILFIVFALRFQEYQVHHSEIPMALAQFFITLPFLLWVVFAYWDRILSAANGKPKSKTQAQKELKDV